MNTIYNYMRSYIPKYTSVSLNSRMDLDIYIGIDDSGEIQGFPYLTNKQHISESIIKEWIYKQFSYLQCINVNDIDVLNAIDVELIELDISQLKYKKDNIEEHLSKCRRIYIEYNEKMKKYKHDIEENWLSFIDRYRIKLETFVNDTTLRNELIRYMKDNNAPVNLINELEKNNYIEIVDGDTIRKYKDNNDSIIYWVAHYKDLKLLSLVENKPKKPRLDVSGLIYPNIIIKRIDMLGPKIIKNELNNKNGLKYYMIKITIRGSRFKDIKYKNMKIRYHTSSVRQRKVDRWVIGYRCIYNNGPYCSYQVD